MLSTERFHFMFQHQMFAPVYYWNHSYTIGMKKKTKKRKQPKFRCSAAILNTQGKVAMETELHWPEMKASEDLDFHCTYIFNHRLFLHQPFSTDFTRPRPAPLLCLQGTEMGWTVRTSLINADRITRAPVTHTPANTPTIIQSHRCAAYFHTLKKRPAHSSRLLQVN